MPLPQSHSENVCTVEAVLATALLAQRKTRIVHPMMETQALLALSRELAASPGNFFDKLVHATRELTGAGSAGISLLNEEEDRFVWPAVTGNLRPYLGSGTPRNFGPCGTILDRGCTLLFIHPERYFTYLAPITPPLEEVLLTPFYMDGRSVGTVWAVIHEKDRQFDAEDRRLLESLSTFAASAYRTLAENGTLAPLLRKKPEMG